MGYNVIFYVKACIVLLLTLGLGTIFLQVTNNFDIGYKEPVNYYNSLFYNYTANLNASEHLFIPPIKENPTFNKHNHKPAETSRFSDEDTYEECFETLNKTSIEDSPECKSFESLESHVKLIAEHMLFSDIRADQINSEIMQPIIDDMYEIKLYIYNIIYKIEDCNLFYMCDSMKSTIFDLIKIYFRTQKVIKEIEIMAISEKTNNIKYYIESIYDRSNETIESIFRRIYDCKMQAAQNK